MLDEISLVQCLGKRTIRHDDVDYYDFDDVEDALRRAYDRACHDCAKAVDQYKGRPYTTDACRALKHE